MTVNSSPETSYQTSYETPSGPNRLFYRNLAGEKPDLLKAIIAFNLRGNQNLNSADQDHGLCPPKSLAEANLNLLIRGANRAKARLVQGEGRGFWDFKEESRRMALFPSHLFNDLILSWGAAFCAPIINRIILRKDLEIVDREIGKNLVDFARGRGRLNLGKLDGIISLPDRAVTPEKIRTLIVMCGMKAHGICRSTWPDSLKIITDNGLEQELPELFEHRFEPERVEPPHFRAVWFSMKKIILKEVAPEWTPCFS